MGNGILKLGLGTAITASLLVTTAYSETRITYKSAKSTSSYFQMGVQISEAMKAGSDGEIIVTVEESQGSVQNVLEAKARGGDYVFTTPPVLVKLAKAGKAMFEGKGDPKFDEIRALFPIPSLTMHFVMSTSSGVNDFAGMEGKTILLGKGSFGAREGAKYLGLFGLEGKVTLAEVELSNAVTEIYDAYAGAQLQGLVALGLTTSPGADTLDGRFAPKGAIPINLSGGLMGQGAPVGATGVAQVATCARILEGRYHNALQPSAPPAYALADTHGGICTTSAVTVLARGDVA